MVEIAQRTVAVCCESYLASKNVRNRLAYSGCPLIVAGFLVGDACALSEARLHDKNEGDSRRWGARSLKPHKAEPDPGLSHCGKIASEVYPLPPVLNHSGLEDVLKLFSLEA